jgi:hypothetical protein
VRAAAGVDLHGSNIDDRWPDPAPSRTVFRMSSCTVIAALVATLVGLGCNRSAPSAPPSDRAPKPGEVERAARPGEVGAHVPDVRLSQTTGEKIALAELLPRHAQTVVVFYRGFW